MKPNRTEPPGRKNSRADFIDVFYGDIEQSLNEDTSSNTASDPGAVATEVSSLGVRGGPRSKASTFGDATSEYTFVTAEESEGEVSKGKTTVGTSAGGHHREPRRKTPKSVKEDASIDEVTVKTPEPPTPAMRPLGLGTPPKKTKITRIRAVEPVKRSLSQVPSAHILGYRDFPQHQAIQQRMRASSPTPNPTIQQEEDRMHKRKSNRVLFVLALIAIICFAMVCAVIILVVINHLSKNSTSEESTQSNNGRLFLGPNSNTGNNMNLVPTFSPTTGSVDLGDPILASLLQRNPAIAACSNGALRHQALSGKKGVGLQLREEGRSESWVDNIPKLKMLNPYWNFSYDAKRIVQQPDDVEFVPMIWGGVNLQWVQHTIETHILPQIRSGEAKRLLGFHEPDVSDQANMSVDDALKSWKELQSAGLPMISPATRNPSGMWMTSFMSKIDSDCLRSEWVAIHWFDIPSFELFRDNLVQYHLQYDRPLLLTEFAAIDPDATSIQDHRWSKEDILDFMKEAVPWLETTPWIQGYSWFSFDESDPKGSSSALFDVTGNLTDCGRYYASIRNELPSGNLRIGNTDVDQINEEYDQPCEDPWTSTPLPLPGKKGLAMQTEAADSTVAWLEEIFGLDSMGVAWTYNFQSESFHHDFGTPVFIPSVANEQQLLTFDISKAEPNSINRMIGFDRPDGENPNTLTVESALDLWTSLESTNVPLVSPVCMDPLGQWMRSFMATVNATCRRVDWIGVRWHGSANFHKFKETITNLYQTYERPLMLTEFALDSEEFYSAPEALTFMKQVLPWLEQTSYVSGYAWSSELNTTSALFNTDGSLTACGEYYASVTADTPEGDQSILQPVDFRNRK